MAGINFNGKFLDPQILVECGGHATNGGKGPPAVAEDVAKVRLSVESTAEESKSNRLKFAML